MSIRTIARLGALPAATAAIALSLAAPAGAHVSATVSDASAGAYTIATFSVPHGCEGSPTTKVEIQVPESVLSVTPTRNPFYDVETTTAQLDEPVADGHGNEVTERTASVVYTATTPLPDGQRDTFELSFQVPDAAGETLAWPTIQTCREGETGWTQVPADGQDEDELEAPAPSFEVLPAAEGTGHDDATAGTADDTTAEADDAAEAAGAAGSADAAADDEDGTSALGWAGLVAGLAGLAAGGLALARTRRS
ncbi:YcnI family copper-binding membrane protein [Nocardioides xinjiangensis]|uniref:YcnI family copper-binding membrane protein n=1 Tax=Nocardioides xinjiangensis TaxID=2817376 RepID=UPI001B316A40|nr:MULTISPECIES: YcnI family protein [unclassified Nocardioides]